MKKFFLISITFLVVIAACHKKYIPVGDGPSLVKYKKTDVAAGKPIYETRCVKCHGLKNTENYTPERWTGILKSMIPKAKLNEEESAQVTAYVMVNAKKS